MSNSNLSVVINTKNAASTLENCLSSVSFADEIVVVDMQSTDTTVDIAKKYNAKVFTHPDVGYADPARDFALEKASNKWILVIDADEEVSATLQKVIKETIANNSDINAYLLPRKNIIFKKWIEHTGWWPDYQVRLFKKGSVSWKVGVHRHPDISGKYEKLKATENNALIHHNYQSVEDYIQRLNRYTSLQAGERSSASTSSDALSIHSAMESFSNEFFQRFFVHEGIKDGLHGLSLSLLQSTYELTIALKQWEIAGFTQDNNTKESIESLCTFHKDMNYWIADYKVKNTSGLHKLYWQIKRKMKR